MPPALSVVVWQVAGGAGEVCGGVAGVKMVVVSGAGAAVCVQGNPGVWCGVVWVVCRSGRCAGVVEIKGPSPPSLSRNQGRNVVVWNVKQVNQRVVGPTRCVVVQETQACRQHTTQCGR